VQQRIVALESFDQRLLLGDQSGKPIDGGRGLGLETCRLTQSIERIVQLVNLVDQRIVVAQRAGTRDEDIAI
jgi:hypothetical protein